MVTKGPAVLRSVNFHPDNYVNCTRPFGKHVYDFTFSNIHMQSGWERTSDLIVQWYFIGTCKERIFGSVVNIEESQFSLDNDHNSEVQYSENYGA